jgi:hypothetical protein
MDVPAIAAVATELSQTRTASAIQLAVLKMAMNVEAQGAMQLVAAAAQATTGNPPNLGTQVDTFA